MESKGKTYWQELSPLWVDGIKSWFGWGGWRKAMTSAVVSIGIVYAFLYFNQVELALENIGQLLFSIVVAGMWFLFVSFITFVVANVKLYKKQQNVISEKEKDIADLKKQIEKKYPSLKITLDKESENEVTLEIYNDDLMDLKDCRANLKRLVVFSQTGEIIDKFDSDKNKFSFAWKDRNPANPEGSWEAQLTYSKTIHCQDHEYIKLMSIGNLSSEEYNGFWVELLGGDGKIDNIEASRSDTTHSFLEIGILLELVTNFGDENIVIPHRHRIKIDKAIIVRDSKKGKKFFPPKTNIEDGNWIDESDN